MEERSVECTSMSLRLRSHLYATTGGYGKMSPVVMNKILSCVIISFRLHQTVSRVLPTSYGELNIKLYGNFFLLTSNCLRWETRRL